MKYLIAFVLGLTCVSSSFAGHFGHGRTGNSFNYNRNFGYRTSFGYNYIVATPVIATVAYPVSFASIPVSASTYAQPVFSAPVASAPVLAPAQTYSAPVATYAAPAQTYAAPATYSAPVTYAAPAPCATASSTYAGDSGVTYSAPVVNAPVYSYGNGYGVGYGNFGVNRVRVFRGNRHNRVNRGVNVKARGVKVKAGRRR